MDYTFTELDFKNSSSVDIVDLQEKIEYSSITSAQINYINFNKIDESKFTIDIHFDNSLSVEDETLLSTLIENYILIVYENKVAILSDKRTPGTNGGTFADDAWRTRVLNTIEGSQNFCTLSSNQFTIQAGSYLIEASATACAVQNHQIRLRNITDNKTVTVSHNGYTTSTNDNLYLVSIVNINTPKTFELQHRCSKTFNNYGYGRSSGFGESEIYCRVIIHNNI